MSFMKIIFSNPNEYLSTFFKISDGENNLAVSHKKNLSGDIKILDPLGIGALKDII